MPESLWNLKNVSLAGDLSNRLDNITLQSNAGVTAIIGYSGAGKTSLLNLLAGMETASSGSITSHISRTAIAESGFSLPLFWAPQDGGLWPHLTAIEHIRAVQNEQTSASALISANSSDNWLGLFDLEHRQHARPGELSKGEQSRLSIARALAANSAVLLMDEPLTHVDPARTPKYWNLIREHIDKTGTSLLFCTHETAAVIRESQSVVCLESGNVRYSGASGQLYHNPPDAEVARFLGPINWFTHEESATWLSDSPAKQEKGGLRPEKILLVADKNGPLQILSFQFSGSYAEAKLKHNSSSLEKTVVHRPPGDVHYSGQSVRIQVIP